MSSLEAQVRLHYAADVQACSRAQLARLIRKDITGVSPRVKAILEDMAITEAQSRGIGLPTFWALTSPD